MSDRIKYLWRQYIAETATLAEVAELFRYIEDTSNDQENGTIFRDELKSFPIPPHLQRQAPEDVLRAILSADVPEAPVLGPVKIRQRRRWLRYAAAFLLFLAGGGMAWWLNRADTPRATTDIRRFSREVMPGHNGAILTLSDGREVMLDSLGDGTVAMQGNTAIRLSHGQLAYDLQAADENVALLYNTTKTPNGRQYQLILPDGTKVWLNAASSLRYPVMFTNKERLVEVSGEAYFEVAQNGQAPFRIKINEMMEIQVLGTHFNINAYANEADIQTTLLEGSVRIVNNGQAYLLAPGQQAQVRGASLRIKKDIDLSQVMAWKAGAFSFVNADVPAVMRQLARWYDIEVRYEGDIPVREFTGEIGRNLSLDQVLQLLTKNRINYRIEHEKLITIVP
ncbi:FecR family protein [Chitinophaga pendula]|uniref:FecR family protein n=1 Tax=Chitinophaga TaxID=79328 RepID=UPI0018DEF1DA|nr:MULTISPECIES: FecR family protein [Chitinophaga]UCJ10166.1 FecR family protein [Chitinophaga pendula]